MRTKYVDLLLEVYGVATKTRFKTDFSFIYFYFISILGSLFPLFRHCVKGLRSETASPSSMVCGSGLDIVSGKNRLAIPPSVSRKPMISNGSTSILLP